MPEVLAEHFSELEQQRDAARLGMWIFLATEVLFFGGLFAAYSTYRFLYPHAFAEGAKHMERLLGGINTAVLLTSSLFMAFAVREAKLGRTRRQIGWLSLTWVLGLAFLAIKGIEYAHHIREGMPEGRQKLFILLYFAMTGLHAIHVTIGLGAIATLAAIAWRERRGPPPNPTPVELTGLYWHFVDIVWIFLFPLLYLLPRS